jgi:Phosphotransferase enzyme family
MGRTVTARITHRDAEVGSIGPFPVAGPWWAEVEPVVQEVEKVLGGAAFVLRLLTVEGADGARDGHVTYHVAALEPPAATGPDGRRHRDARPGGTRRDGSGSDLLADHPSRLPWARADGIEALLAWAGAHVEILGRARQVRSWNLSALFRLETPRGPVWLKAFPPFAAAEPAALAAFAGVDPGLVPEVLATGPGRVLLADVPGRDGWDASGAEVGDVVGRLVTAQFHLADPEVRSAAGGEPLPDRRPEVLAGAVRDLLDGPVGAELTPQELRAARRLAPGWEVLAGCGLPDTVVHGDFHPGNWRCADGRRPVVLDLADAHRGNPVLDGRRALDFLPTERRGEAARAWISAWARAVPRSRPAEALSVAGPLAHLAYAVRYQEFLDRIEPDERVYHAGDPAAAIRQALAAAG